MLLLFISIICSVLVGLLFKASKLKFNELIWSILIGYTVCFILGNLFLDFSWSFHDLSIKYISISVVLSILMPTLFIAVNYSVVKNGIAKTDLIQRMSLLLPIIASFFLFSEKFTMIKAIALLIGFFSIYLIMHRNEKNVHNFSLFPLLYIFLGYGLVDILFKTLTHIPFQFSLVIIYLGCFIITLFYIIIKRLNFFSKSLYIGFLLGVLNFSNIYTYLLAHKNMSESPMIVFTCMNLGVICLGVLVGKYIFKEKLSRTTLIGILCAIFVILLLSYQSLFK